MWPIFLYMTKDECLRTLRQLELEAYSMMVSALRAQGPLTQDKRKILKDASKILNISAERHKCEVRRAVNDEKLNTLAYHLNGPGISLEDWFQEGRRVLPMLQRILPQTLQPIVTDNLSFDFKKPHAIEVSEMLGEQVLSDMSVNENEMIEDLESHANPIESQVIEKPYSTSEKATTSILHKTLSVPISKVTKLNLEKFKIIPSSFSSTIKQGGKKIIPLSQLQMLNHKLGSKGGIKVLPINSKIFGKNITMTRITPQHGFKTSVMQPFLSNAKEVSGISKVKVENIEMPPHDTVGEREEINNEPSNVIIEVASSEMDNLPDSSQEGGSLQETDSSGFIEPEIKDKSDS